MVVVLIWLSVALVIGLYVLFVVLRLRAERRRKAMDQNADSTPSSTIARAATITPPVVPPTTATPTSPTAATTPASATTVAEALAGIHLPNGLAPLTTMAERGGVGDRVAFWTDVPAEVVGPAFGDELERLGYATTSLDQDTLAAQRGGTNLVAVIHPDGPKATIGTQPAFASVPELSTVIEIWLAT
jgi:hypothetical protein